MVEYFLKDLTTGIAIKSSRTDSWKKISDEAMWYQNRGYKVTIIQERQVPQGQTSLTIDSD